MQFFFLKYNFEINRVVIRTLIPKLIRFFMKVGPTQWWHITKHIEINTKPTEAHNTLYSIEFAYKFFHHRSRKKISCQSKSPIQLSYTKFFIYFLFLFLQKSQGTTLYFLFILIFVFQISSLVLTLTNEISFLILRFQSIRGCL